MRKLILKMISNPAAKKYWLCYWMCHFIYGSCTLEKFRQQWQTIYLPRPPWAAWHIGFVLHCPE